MKQEKISKLFKQHLSVEAIFQDGNGKLWVSKETAEKQPNSDKMKVILREEKKEKAKDNKNASLGNSKKISKTK